MKAWIYKNNDLFLEQSPLPTLLEDEVLIKVKAISLNPVDYKITKGEFSLETPRIIGIDAAGFIEQVGEACSKELINKRVVALVNIFQTGSFSEYVKVNKNILSIIPDEISFEEASTIPCAGVTAYQAVMEKINLRKNQSVLFTVANGSVGKFAIALAKLKGAKIIALANTNKEDLLNLGADFVIDYKNEDVLSKVREVTNNKGVDYIIDMLSFSNILKYKDLLRFNGSIVGITGIPSNYPFDGFTKAAALIEVALVAAYTNGDEDSLKEIAFACDELFKLLKDKKIQTNIAKVVSFEELKTNLQSFSNNSIHGKIVVKL